MSRDIRHIAAADGNTCQTPCSRKASRRLSVAVDRAVSESRTAYLRGRHDTPRDRERDGGRWRPYGMSAPSRLKRESFERSEKVAQ